MFKKRDKSDARRSHEPPRLLSAEALLQQIERRDREDPHVVEPVAVAGLDRDRALAIGPDDGNAGMPGGMAVAAPGRSRRAGLADRPRRRELAADLAGEQQRVGLGRGRDAGQLLLAYGEQLGARLPR